MPRGSRPSPFHGGRADGLQRKPREQARRERRPAIAGLVTCFGGRATTGGDPPDGSGKSASGGTARLPPFPLKAQARPLALGSQEADLQSHFSGRSRLLIRQSSGDRMTRIYACDSMPWPVV